MSSRTKQGVIVFDMDDTLVDRESVYTAAQVKMLRTLKMFGATGIRIPSSLLTLRRIELLLIDFHEGDHMYDYAELARALWLRFVDKLSQRSAAEQAYQENHGKRISFRPAVVAALAHDAVLRSKMPQLLNSAKHVLRKLKKQYFLILFPSGNVRFQRRVVRHHCFDAFFDYIIIKRVKNMSSFREVKSLAIRLFEHRFGRKPERLVMVGDRISQDVAPARTVGFETVWIPGPYFPGDGRHTRPTHTISKLRDLLPILLVA